MKKIIKIVSILIILFTISFVVSYAAIMSDNDGSAFVSKSEFEALKNNFDSQVEQYNLSISNKIDGAIAAYLAGLKLSTEQVIENSKSILTYPLDIYNQEWTYTHDSWDSQTGTTKWWSPSISWNAHYYSCGGTYGSTGTNSRQVADYYKLIFDRFTNNKNRINNFYNVESYETVNNTCIIDGTLKNYNILNDYNCLIWVRESWNSWTAGKYGIGVRMDQSQGEQKLGVSSVTLTKQRSDGDDLYKTDEVPNIAFFAYYDANSHTWTYTANTYFNTWSTSGGASIYFYEPGKITPDRLKSWSKRALITDWDKSASLQLLYNTSNSTCLIPVAYNNVVYYTNNKKFKQDIKQDSSSTKEAHAYHNNALVDTTIKNPRLISFIDAGWCLEADGHSLNSSHRWYEHSLINPSRVKYKVQTPIEGSMVEQSILEGILISEVPKVDLDCMKIKLNIQRYNDTNKRYIVVSKKPIIQYDPTSLVEDDLISIYKDKNCKDGTGVKLFELSDGNNEIYFKDVEEKDDIYIKVLWNVSDQGWTRIVEEPEVSIFS